MALLALAWGLLAASAVFVGAAIGWYARLPQHTLALMMAFGSGILLSVVAYEIVDDAYADGGLVATAAGYAIGAVAFTLGLLWLNRAGARDRKRAVIATGTLPSATAVVALATILDSVPESLIIGFNFYNGEGIAFATVAAVFLSNIPEGVTSTTRMRNAGRSLTYVVVLWSTVAAAGALATAAGYLLMEGAPREVIALMQAIGGGALLVLVVDTMIPEVFSETHDATGLVTAAGFLTGFVLSAAL